jgi:anti-sigma factor RsiW
MNGHPEYLELIAASIDFELTDEEFGRLSTHLARCPECRAAADEIRGDAAGIAAYPPPRLAPARSEQILRAALRTPPARPRWGLLAVAALLATLGGGVLFAGFQLIQDDDSTPQEPPPSLVAEASAPPSEAPTEEPDEGGVVATDAPSLDPTPTPKQQPAPA